MRTYIGTKIVQAEPMTELEWVNASSRYPMPAGESRDGYKVVYEDGYMSWSPKDTFERAYRKITNEEKGLMLPPEEEDN